MYTSDNEVRALLPAPTGEAAETSTKRKTRQLSVKGVDEKTIELAREAAQRRGLRVSAWIRMELHDAAVRTLNELSENAVEDRAMKVLRTQLESLWSQQLEEKSKLESKLDEIKQDVTDIIRLQHRLASKAL